MCTNANGIGHDWCRGGGASIKKLFILFYFRCMKKLTTEIHIYCVADFVSYSKHVKNFT
jgi:hypothetical protein